MQPHQPLHMLEVRMLLLNSYDFNFFFKVVKRITGGGADYSFECIGDTGMVTAALQSCCDVSPVIFLLISFMNSIHQSLVTTSFFSVLSYFHRDGE